MSDAGRCCADRHSLTPRTIINVPGMTKLDYRIGRHSEFLQSMIARLHQARAVDTAEDSSDSGRFPLQERFKTRKASDPSMALLDAWATVADVLTFYQERIANEGYLGTAVQNRSLHELTSLVGYRPRPGLSASVALAFNVENSPSQSQVIRANEVLPKGGVLIPKGTAVESTPAPGTAEEPQTFETSDDLIAFQAWNDIRMRQTQPQCITKFNVRALEQLYLEGTSLGLKVNDLLVITLPDVATPVQYQIHFVDEDSERQVTIVRFPKHPFSAQGAIAALTRAIDTFPGSFSQREMPFAPISTPKYQATVQTALDEILKRAKSGAVHSSLAKMDTLFSSFLKNQFPKHEAVTARLAAFASRLEEMLRPDGVLNHENVINEYADELVRSIDRFLQDDRTASELIQKLDTTNQAEFVGKILESLHQGHTFASVALSSERLKADVNKEVWLDGQAFVSLPHSQDDIEIEVAIIAGEPDDVAIRHPNASDWSSVNERFNPKGQRFKHVGITAASQIQSFINAVRIQASREGTWQIEISIWHGSHCIGIATKRFQVGDQQTLRFSGSLYTVRVASVASENAKIPLGDHRSPTLFLVPHNYDKPVLATLSLLPTEQMKGDSIVGRLEANSMAELLDKLADTHLQASGTAEKAGPRVVRIQLHSGLHTSSPDAVIYREILVTHDSTADNSGKSRAMPARLAQLHFQATVRDPENTELKPPRLAGYRNAFMLDTLSPDVTNQVESLKDELLTRSRSPGLVDMLRIRTRISRELPLSLNRKSTVYIRLAEEVENGFGGSDERASTKLRAVLKEGSRKLTSLPDDFMDVVGQQIQMSVAIKDIAKIYDVLAAMKEFPAIVRELSKLLPLQSAAGVEIASRFGALRAATRATSDAMLSTIKSLRIRIIEHFRALASRQFDFPNGSTNPTRFLDRLLAEQSSLQGIDIAGNNERLDRIIQDIAQEVGIAFKCGGRDNEYPSDPFLAELVFQLSQLCDQPAPAPYANPTDLLTILQQLSEPTEPAVSGAMEGQLGNNLGLLAQLAVGKDNELLREAIFAVMRRKRVTDTKHRAKVWVLPTQANVFGWNAPPKNSAISDLQINPFVEDVVTAFPSPPRHRRSHYHWYPWWLQYKANVMDHIRARARAFLRRETYDLQQDGEGREEGSRLFLDGEYSGIRADDIIAIRTRSEEVPTAIRVVSVKIRPRTAYRLSGNATDIRLEKAWWDPQDRQGTFIPERFEDIQNSRVFCEARQLQLAEEPFPVGLPNLPTTLCDDGNCDSASSQQHLAVNVETSQAASSDGSLASGRDEPVTLTLDSVVEGLAIGQLIAVEGSIVVGGSVVETQATNEIKREVTTIRQVCHSIRDQLFGDRFVTKITVDPLKYSYLRSSMRINANIVDATHGKTTLETIGDGNGAKPFSKHRLNSLPMSRLPAPTAAGYENMLEVFVNDVRWTEERSFLGTALNTESYVTRNDHTGGTTVIFGDGHGGARPPTGVDNIQARYRFGLGTAGNVSVGRIDQVSGSPIGVTGVVNPVGAEGGADPDELHQTRLRAPLAVSAFDRLVSVSDYRDFALIYAGVGKAFARLGASGKVELTIAANHPGPISTDSSLFQNLQKAIRNHSDAGQQRFNIHDRRICFLVVRAKVKIDPARQWVLVHKQLRHILLTRFGYTSAQFGKDLFLADALAAIHSVPGVVAAKVIVFQKIDHDTASDLTPKTISPTIKLDIQDHPAELCYLNPDIPGSLALEPSLDELI